MSAVLEHDFVFEADAAMFARMVISYATDQWLGELERQGHAESTVASYRRLLDKLSAAHPHVHVNTLAANDIRRFLDSESRRRDGARKSPATIGQNVSILHGFFDWLTKEGYCKQNPTMRNGERIIERPRQVAPEDNDNVVTISPDEVRRLLAESRRYDDRWDEKLAIACLAYLGPRRKAIARARLRDYDSEAGTITFREKGGKTITKPVPDELRALIEAAIAAVDPKTLEPIYKDGPDSYLVPSRSEQRRQGERDDRIIWRIVREVADRAGVTSHVHAIRAAFAVHFLQANPGQVVTLQQLMGHRRIETTMVYLRRMDRKQAMEQVRSLSWETPVDHAAEAKRLYDNLTGHVLEGVADEDRDKLAGVLEAMKPGVVVEQPVTAGERKAAAAPRPTRKPKAPAYVWPAPQPQPEVLSAAKVDRLLAEEAAARVRPQVAAEHTVSERVVDEALHDGR